jgi:hypothetical protein
VVAERQKERTQQSWFSDTTNEDNTPICPYKRFRARVHDLIDPGLFPFQFRAQMGMEEQWLPSDVAVDEEGSATFLSEINNLDVARYPTFQQHCSAALTKMIPHFEVVLNQNLRGRKLQVIVKAQQYQVWPGGVYEGDLHVEGTKYERIAAVGIFYLAVDPRLQGGQLELARVEASGCGWVSVLKDPVNVYANQCVVFDNRRAKGFNSIASTQYHRMMPLTFPSTAEIDEEELKTQSPAERMILSFFLVDPNKTPIPSTATEKGVNRRFAPDVTTEERLRLWNEALAVRTTVRQKRNALNQKDNPHLRTRTGYED